MGWGGRFYFCALGVVSGLLTGGPEAYALDPAPTTLTFGLAGFAQNLFKSVSTSETAQTSALSTVFPSVMVGGAVPFRAFSERERLRFQVGFSPIGLAASDGEVSRRVLWVSPLLSHDFEGFSLHGGLCAWLTLYSSARGTVTLNNGNSTDRYYIPSAGETTRVFAFQVGAVVPVFSSLDFQADLLVAAPLSSSRRTLAAIVSLQVPVWF